MSGANATGLFSMTLKISGQEVEANFARWGQAIETFEPVFEQIGDDLRGDFALNMLMEGGLFGKTKRSALGENAGPWTPLMPSTVKDRQRKGFEGEHPILFRTGMLARSLAERNAPGNVFQVGANFLTVGTSIAYAGFHQRGTRNMKARVIVGLSYERRQRIKARLRAYITEQARLAGLKAGLGRATEDFWNE